MRRSTYRDDCGDGKNGRARIFALYFRKYIKYIYLGIYIQKQMIAHSRRVFKWNFEK